MDKKELENDLQKFKQRRIIIQNNLNAIAGIIQYIQEKLKNNKKTTDNGGEKQNDRE